MKHGKMQEIALERILRLFELAEKEFAKHPQRSKRYVQIAREIGKKTLTRFPGELKTRFCKKCGAYLKDGENSQTEKKGALIVVKCLECGAERKTGLKPKK